MDEPRADRSKEARDALSSLHAELVAATRKAIGDDGRILFGATSALDVAVEALFPPHGDPKLAAENCREALKLMKLTRAYAQRESGGNTARAVEQATARIEKIIESLGA